MLKYVANRKLVNVLQGDKIITLILSLLSVKNTLVNIISEYLGSESNRIVKHKCILDNNISLVSLFNSDINRICGHSLACLLSLGYFFLNNTAIGSQVYGEDQMKTY